MGKADSVLPQALQASRSATARHPLMAQCPVRSLTSARHPCGRDNDHGRCDLSLRLLPGDTAAIASVRADLASLILDRVLYRVRVRVRDKVLADSREDALLVVPIQRPFAQRMISRGVDRTWPDALIERMDFLNYTERSFELLAFGHVVIPDARRAEASSCRPSFPR